MNNDSGKKSSLLRDVATVLLLLLLMLTFLSNTLMYHSLPLVSIDTVGSGVLTTAIRGTGTVTSAGTVEVKCPAERLIKSVEIKEGQKLKKGDLMFTFGGDPDGEVDTELIKLDLLFDEYDSYALNGPQLTDYSEHYVEIPVEVNGTETTRKVTIADLKYAVEAVQHSGEDIYKKYYMLYKTKYDYETAKINSTRLAEANGVTWTNASLDAMNEKIGEVQRHIRELLGEGTENSLFAPADCTVSKVNAKEGDMIRKGTTLCILETDNSVHTLSFSVKPELAERLHVGDAANVGNGYIDSGIDATLKSIKMSDDGNLLTFELKGRVLSGDNLTILIGKQSTEYDLIVPNSAIHTDSYGSYVLTVTAQGSGTNERYTAHRAAIEVLASDDYYSAVSGRLSKGEWVVVKTDAPIADGDQVRLDDSRQ